MPKLRLLMNYIYDVAYIDFVVWRYHNRLINSLLLLRLSATIQEKCVNFGKVTPSKYSTLYKNSLVPLYFKDLEF